MHNVVLRVPDILAARIRCENVEIVVHGDIVSIDGNDYPASRVKLPMQIEVQTVASSTSLIQEGIVQELLIVQHSSMGDARGNRSEFSIEEVENLVDDISRKMKVDERGQGIDYFSEDVVDFEPWMLQHETILIDTADCWKDNAIVLKHPSAFFTPVTKTEKVTGEDSDEDDWMVDDDDDDVDE
jgi:hypothetical protein